MKNPAYENIRALTAWDEGADVKLVCKIKNPETGEWKRGIKTIKNFQWYFVLSREEFDKPEVEALIDFYYNANVVSKVEFYAERWVKIYATKTRKNINHAKGETATLDELLKQLKKDGVTLYEADLSLWKRFMTDNFIEVAGELDILYFDIETDDTNGGIEIGRDTILSWAAINQKGELFFHMTEQTQGGEKKCLEEFLNVVANHDLLCGWNSGGFDLPYIEARMAVHGLTYDFRKKLHIDMMQRCARIYSYDMFNIGLKGFSLNEVSRVFLGEKKVDRTMGIKEMWLKDPAQLKKYNVMDVRLLLHLDKKLLVTDLMIKECQWTGAFLDRFYIGELLDNYILRRTRELGFFQYTRPDRSQTVAWENIQIRGGYVMSPIAGLYDNVRVCDFRSLYPSIIVGFNIGRDSLNKDLSDQGFIALDTFLRAKKMKIEEVPFEEWKAFLESEKVRLDPNNENIQAANNTFFKRDTISFVGALVKQLLELRAQWKAQAKHLPKDDPEYVNIQQSQGIVKEMANSMYGITGDKSSRYFDQHVAEAITLTGQYMNRLSSYFAEQHGYTTIYGDTDSIFVPVEKDEDMEQLIVDINADFADYLDNDIGVIDNIVLLQYEKKFARLIMLDKKRYTGRMVLYDGTPVDRIFSRGTENIKKSTIRVAREAIIELINMMVKDDPQLDKTRLWVEALMFKVMHTEIPVEDLTMIIKVSKPTQQYKSKTLHVKLAERLISEGKLLPIVEGKRSWGTRLDYLVVRDPTTGKQEGILPDEYQGTWDRTYYWDIQIYGPIRRILETVWPNEDWEKYAVAAAEKRLADAKKKEEKLAKVIASELLRKQKATDKVTKKESKTKEALEKLEEKRKERRLSLTKNRRAKKDINN